MSELLQDLLQAFQDFFIQANLLSNWTLLVLLICLGGLSLWLLFIVIRLLIAKRNSIAQYSFTFYRNWFLAGVLVSAIVTGIIASHDCQARDQDFIFGSIMFAKFHWLILLLLISVFTVLRYARWSNSISEKNLPKHASISLTSASRVQTHLFLSNQIKNWRWAILLPFLSLLLIIPCVQREEKVFLAIVLDNSTSMIDPIANGKEVLAEALFEIEQQCAYIITTLQEGTISNMSELMAIEDPKRLAGVSRQFSNTEDAVSYIISDNVKAENPDSPIAEATWKTFLLAVNEESVSTQFQKRVLIIVTDGGDNIREMSSFFCFDDRFNELFDPSEILVVDVNKESESQIQIGFVNASSECGYTIGIGKDYDSYSNSVRSLIGDIAKKPPFWTIWAGLFCLITALLILVISPSKLK